MLSIVHNLLKTNLFHCRTSSDQVPLILVQRLDFIKISDLIEREAEKKIIISLNEKDLRNTKVSVVCSKYDNLYQFNYHDM